MNITLIGMAGAGKSTVGKKLAERLDFAYIDIDELTERQTRKSINDFIKEYSPVEFIEAQERTTMDLGNLSKFVISTGGSAIYGPRSMQYLSTISTVVFLHPQFETLEHRLTNLDQRGMIGLKNRNLRTLYEERLPLYHRYADITLPLEEYDDPDVVVQKIALEMLGNF